jgi:hypothetical protein
MRNRTAVDCHVSTRDGHGHFLGSSKGDVLVAVLRQLRAKREDQEDSSLDSFPSRKEINVRLNRLIEDYRLAILEKARSSGSPSKT